jgi:glycosyltransferase involved in cell wall biosynthesis
MCSALTHLGHDVSLYANESPDPYLIADKAQFDLRYFPVHWNPYQVSLSLAKALSANVKRFDLVHIHMLHRFPQAVAAFIARKTRIPYCIQPHGALAPYVFFNKRKYARQTYLLMIERRDIESAAGVVHTAKEEEQWTGEIGLHPRQSFIVPIGADVAKLSRHADPSCFRRRFDLGGQRIILWMGRIVQAKGLPLLLEGVAQSLRQATDVSVVLAGPDPVGHRAQLESLASLLGIRDKIIFTGPLDGEDKQRALCSAEIFVLPSHSENFGLAALEAMAVGHPVLLSPGVCIANEVAMAGAGLILQRDANAWGAALAGLLADKERCTKMGEEGRRFAWRYDWSNVVTQLERSYYQMVES